MNCFEVLRPLLVVIAVLLIPACGGKGGSSDGGPATSGGNGWLTLTTPTSDPTFSTGAWTLTLGGEAFMSAWSYSGDVAPAVTWSNPQASASGTAVDTVTWGSFFGSIFPLSRRWDAAVPLVSGTNVITVSAVQGPDWGQRTITVTHPPGSNPPVVLIDPITPSTPTTTNTTPLNLHGSASSSLALTSITWTNTATSGTGPVPTAYSWNVAIPLMPGTNPISITATDSVGAMGTASVTITYDPSRVGPFPAGPSGLQATSTDQAVTLTWNPVPGAVSYNVYRATATGVSKTSTPSLPGGTLVNGVPSSPHVESGLTNGTTYFFVVTAVDGVGEGVESAEVSAAPVAASTGPVTLAASNLGSGTPRLNGSLTAPTGYSTTAWFEYGTSPSYGASTPSVSVAAGGPTPVWADLSGLSQRTTYYYRLVTQNAGGTFPGAGLSFFIPVLPQVLVSGLDAATDLAVDASSVYWVEIYAQTAKKISTGGGTPTLLSSPTMGGNGACLAIDGANVTFSDYGTLWQVPLGGGTTTPLLSGLANINRLSVLGTQVFWRESGAIREIDLSSGPAVTVMTGPNIFGGGLAVDGSGIYWTDYWGGLVQTTGLTGGPVLTLASGLDHPNTLILSAGTLIWAEGTAIHRMPATGGAVSTVVSGISPGLLAIDSGFLYWTDGSDSLKKIDLTSSQVTTLVMGESGFYGMAVDGTSVYWLTPGSRYDTSYGSLKKVPKS